MCRRSPDYECKGTCKRQPLDVGDHLRCPLCGRTINGDSPPSWYNGDRVHSQCMLEVFYETETTA
jgi:hypothetical protein